MFGSKLREIWLLTPKTAFQVTTGNVKKKLESVLAIYEDLIGVTQVKQSHNALLQAELKFIQVQEERRQAQTNLSTIQEKVRDIRFQLDRTPRGQENYLELVKQEIELIREERTLREIFDREEKSERERFTQLSTCLRASYEKERAQSEKTKPLFLLMSVVGGLIGATISALSSQSKVKQLKQLIIDSNRAQSQFMTTRLEEIIKASSSSAQSSAAAATMAAVAVHQQQQQAEDGGGSSSNLSILPPPILDNSNGICDTNNMIKTDKVLTVQNGCLFVILSLLVYQIIAK